MSAPTNSHSCGLFAGSSNFNIKGVTFVAFKHVTAEITLSRMVRYYYYIYYYLLTRAFIIYFAPAGWTHLFQGIDNNAFHNAAIREATFELEVSQHIVIKWFRGSQIG